MFCRLARRYVEKNMTRVKSAKNFNTKAEGHIASHLILGVFLTFIGLQIVEYINFKDDTFTIIGVGISIALVFISLIRGFILYKASSEPFRCGECNSEIKEPLKNSMADGEAIIYKCSACDILWHVGNTSSH
jgi:hypothetical protein